MLAFQKGKESAFEQLVAEYRLPVLHFVLKTIPDRHRAEDLTQEVFLRVYKARARYRRTARFSTWLFTIARRLSLNELRAQRRRQKLFVGNGSARIRRQDGTSDDLIAETAEVSMESPVERLERHELEAAVDRLVRCLPANQQAALQLHRGEDLSYSEIAEVLGVTTLAVKSLLVRARRTLREGLDQYFHHSNAPGEDLA